MDSRSSPYKKDMIINRINEKLVDYLQKYTTALSEVNGNEEITIRFTLDNSNDIIEISSSDIKYYVQNDMDQGMLSVYDLVYHNLVHIEELFDNKSQELKNLLIFLEDREGIIKKQIMEAIIEHKKNDDDKEIEKFSYEDDIYKILYGNENINNDDLK